MVAWIRFPGLNVEPLKQSYERISELKYIYSSGNFKAVLETDETGFVTNYEGILQEC